MKSIENIVSELNALIQTEKLDERQYTELLNSLSNLVNYKILWIDLATYNEELLEKAKREKLIGVETQNHEWAAYHRDLEEECKKHIELKNQLNIKTSFLQFEPNRLLFFYMGTSSFEAKFKEFLLNYIVTM